MDSSSRPPGEADGRSPRPSCAWVHSRFAAAFGPPLRTYGKDYCWELWPTRHAEPLSILTKGRSKPVVWVFDPNDPADGARSFEIRSDADVEPVIVHINQRLRHAGR